MKRFILITCVIAVGWIGCDTSSGPEETVSTPDRPSGPEWLLWEDPTGTYATGGSVSSLGHPVVYEFSWGDGFTSGWGEPERWTGWEWRTGTRRYIIRAQARCAEHYDIVSPLSDALVVTVEQIESFTPETFITYCPGPVADFSTFVIQWDGTDNVSAGNQMLYSWYLEGYDETWSEFLRQREWGYYQVPDGSYTFHVRAQDEAGNIDSTEASCTFEVAVSPICEISVTSPADGDVWPDTTLQWIEWDYSGDAYAVKIDLYSHGEYVTALKWPVINSGRWEWYVTSELADSLNGLQFKVSDWSDPDCYGWSGVFSISK
jgi:hypothetical protein